MLWNVSRLGDFRLEAADGAIGAIDDCLFEHDMWTLRWFVIDTGTWLAGRQVLFAPAQVGTAQAEDRVLTLDATREQVEESPPLESEAPVSRRYETRLIDHYGWPAYWMGMPDPPVAVPDPMAPDVRNSGISVDEHLRSTGDMTGHYVHAIDGDIGHIDDFLLDPDGWAIRYLVIDTRNWWPGKRVLIVPGALEGIDWDGRVARLSLSRAQIQDGPEFDPSRTIDRAWEERYHAHHDIPRYWV